MIAIQSLSTNIISILKRNTNKQIVADSGLHKVIINVGKIVHEIRKPKLIVKRQFTEYISVSNSNKVANYLTNFILDRTHHRLKIL